MKNTVRISNDVRAYAHLEYQSLSHELKLARRLKRKLQKSRNRLLAKKSSEPDHNAENLEAISVQESWWDKLISSTKAYARAHNVIIGYLNGHPYEKIETIRYTDVHPAPLGRCLTDLLDNDDITAFYKWYAQRPAIAGKNDGAV